MGFLGTKTRVILILTIIAIAGLVLITRDTARTIETVIAKQGTITEEVSVTGRVEPVDRVDLAFELGGRVSYVPVHVGDRVVRGETLATLSNSGIRASLARADAALATQEAALAQLRVGSREEAVAVDESKVAAAARAVIDARAGLASAIRDAYIKSDDAVRNRVDQFMSNPRGSNPSLNFSASNESLVESTRVAIEVILTGWDASLSELSAESEIEVFIQEADANLSDIQPFLNIVSVAVNDVKSSSVLSQTTIDGWRSDVSTARTNVQTARSNLVAKREVLNAARSDLALKQNQLALTNAPPTAEEVQKQEAHVTEAKASVTGFESDLAQTVIRAPFSGIVTVVEVEPGEIVTVNTIAITLISDSAFEIETFVPEADVAKLSVGDSAQVTLDAYGDDIFFAARIASINPAETVIEGVSTYKTVLHFQDSGDSRIKSGMTANVDIETNRKDAVIIVPLKAVVYDDEGDTVRVLKAGGVIEKVPVETGIESTDGTVEIISGLSDGDEVVTYFED